MFYFFIILVNLPLVAFAGKVVFVEEAQHAYEFIDDDSVTSDPLRLFMHKTLASKESDVFVRLYDVNLDGISDFQINVRMTPSRKLWNVFYGVESGGYKSNAVVLDYDPELHYIMDNGRVVDIVPSSGVLKLRAFKMENERRVGIKEWTIPWSNSKDIEALSQAIESSFRDFPVYHCEWGELACYDWMIYAKGYERGYVSPRSILYLNAPTLRSELEIGYIDLRTLGRPLIDYVDDLNLAPSLKTSVDSGGLRSVDNVTSNALEHLEQLSPRGNLSWHNDNSHN